MENYVSFELAKKLKEKGFPQHWSDQVYILENEYDEEWFEVGAKYIVELVPDFMSTVSAPPVSLVLKWLRDSHKIHVSVVFWDMGWYADIQNFDNDNNAVENVFQSDDYLSYEQAAIAGIEYVLDNVL